MAKFARKIEPKLKERMAQTNNKQDWQTCGPQRCT